MGAEKGVTKFQNKLYLRVILTNNVTKYDSPSSYSLRYQAVHTDSQAVGGALFCLSNTFLAWHKIVIPFRP